jgi:hypothetical protein
MTSFGLWLSVTGVVMVAGLTISALRVVLGVLRG